MFFGDFEKNVKNVKKRTHSFTGHLITQPLIHNYRKSVGLPVSHQHQTSCSEMQTPETMHLRTVCDKRLQVPITSWNFEANISIKRITLRELGIELR